MKDYRQDNLRRTHGASDYILLVEPSRALRALARKACVRRGLSLEFAPDIGDALSRVCRRPPIAVITSIELPGLPGTALVAALKSVPTHARIPIGLLTTRDSSSVQVGVYQADAILHKDSSLVAGLERFLDSVRGESPVSGADVYSAPPRRLLLADDSSSIQKLISRWLKAAEYEVTIAGNGREAVDLASHGAFDLILMDVEMPEMDGMAAAGELRRLGVRTPIVALTGSEDDAVHERLRQSGCEHVMTKPVKRNALLANCRCYLDDSALRTPARN